jgi:predicted permease
MRCSCGRCRLRRLLSPADDAKPGASPVAVVAYDYWMRRFGGDPSVIGRTFRSDFGTLEIVGVAPNGFTGTEPGLITDVFMPAKLNAEALNTPGWSWFRIWLRPGVGVDAREVQSLLQASFRAEHLERVKRFPADTPNSRIEAYLSEQLLLQPAGAGVSVLQKSFRRPLWIVASLAALLLLIACANVANLLLARSTTRRVELALRVSIGASRQRLVQLMLVESALLALAACAIGVLFATWAAPFIVSLLAPVERPVKLVLAFDWRTLAAGVIITLSATMLLGVLPALRASNVRPVRGALKESRASRGHRRVTDAIVAGQMALCVFLLFGAALFVGTLGRLQNKPLGFDAGGVMHAIVEGRQRLDGAAWQQIADSVRALPRIESVALAAWAPLTGNRWRSSVTVPGIQSPSAAPNWVNVGPGYFAAMRTRLIEGREFVAHDVPPQNNGGRIVPGVAIVNRAFARAYFGGASPIGRRVIVDSSAAPLEIVGRAEDAVYFNVRETMHPAVFVPFGPRHSATLLVRTAATVGLRAALVQEISNLSPGLRVREVEPLDAYVTQQMVRERLLATLSTFFASLALILSAIGLYGILNYAVTRERRQIGLRMALGATASHVVALITARVVVLLCAGAAAGLASGFVLGRASEALLFHIAPTDIGAIAPPILALVAAALLAALPPALRAVRVDPMEALKLED